MSLAPAYGHLAIKQRPCQPRDGEPCGDSGRVLAVSWGLCPHEGTFEVLLRGRPGGAGRVGFDHRDRPANALQPTAHGVALRARHQSASGPREGNVPSDFCERLVRQHLFQLVMRTPAYEGGLHDPAQARPIPSRQSQFRV